MLVRRYQWMGIVSLVLTLLLLSDSLIVRATESGTIIGEGTSENAEQYIVDEDKIWALIDRDELRSLIDVDELKETLDLEAVRSQIDKEALLEQISDINLLGTLSSEEILEDYNALKKADKLDEYIKKITGADGFDEDYIKNHPVDVPNVKIPITTGTSPLDYILDPLGLIYQTQAAKYGGGEVQENANVLFKNTEGEYLFSSTSDMMKIVNKGNVPLQVTISAKIENNGSVQMVDSSSELEGEEPSIFMALVGKDGILGVMNETGSSEISLVLNAVPDGTYKFTLNEETGEYESELSEKADESKFDSFEFGVTGECNTEANWSEVGELPKISVSWKTEPILTDWDKVNEQLEEADKVKFEAYKKVKLEELREAELERLIQIQVDDIISEDLEKLIDEEVERLAQIRFEELKELAIRGELDLGSGDSGGMLILDDENGVEDSEAEGDEEGSETGGVASDEGTVGGENREDAGSVNTGDADAGAGDDGNADTGNADVIDEDGAGALGNSGGAGDVEEINEDSSAGMNSSAKAYGRNSAVLGATRERIEFIESEDGSEDDNVIESFDSEDGEAEDSESGDSVIFF